MKKLIGLSLALVFTLTLAACGGANGTKEADDTTYLSVDINPGVEFVLDDEGDVESVVPLNEDAEVVIADLDLEGQSSDQALEAFIDEAVETGYIDVESDENAITVTSDDEEEEEAKKAEVESILEERAIGAAVFGGEMNEEYEELAQEHDISAGRARLISRAVEFSDDLTFEDALEMDKSEIMAILVDEHRAQMEAFVEKRKEAALETKESMKALIQEKVQAHRDAVENGEKDTPDLDQIREDLKAGLEDIRSHFESRIEERRQDIEDSMPEDTD